MVDVYTNESNWHLEETIAVWETLFPGVHLFRRCLVASSENVIDTFGRLF
jgi:hypothetical protein